MAAPPRKRKIDPAPPSTYRFSDDLYVERGIVAAWLIPPGFPADTQRQYAQVLARMVLSYHDPRLHPQFPARVRALLGELEAAPDAADEPAPDAAAVVAEVRALVANIGTVLKAALDTPSATAAGVVRDVNAQLNGLSLIALGGRMQLQMLLQQLYREVFGAAYDAADVPRVDALDVRALSEFRNIGRLGPDGFGDAGTMTVTRDPFASAAEQKAVYMGEMHEAAIRAGSTHTKYLLAHLGLSLPTGGRPLAALALAAGAPVWELLPQIGAAAAAVARERPARGLRAVLAEIVAECAAVDRFAQVVAAIQTMRALADQRGLVQEPWRYVAPRGMDILQLHSDYARLATATTTAARRAELMGRAARIWASLAPHFDRAPP